ncbi:hypothetical protein [Dyella sp. 333MFSha]|uniref:hypothetical protein n=1 Tax=Dyella sp. 333MFSha TaxID=1798240 RepID=UPI000887BCCF|nr:hypothetical protein [Dyella sp. 333MFSha]SDG47268.1 hypothetical protein SAMN04515659_2856 [Dyella sp. 333MFSha]
MQKSIVGTIKAIVPLLVLVLANIITFGDQYAGTATFPWDFLGGYHAQSVGWFLGGGVTSPPTWFPWTSMGFPAFLAIQSGAWYLPLVLLSAFGVTYSIYVATVVQVLHVLFGALGAYALVRRLGVGRAVSLAAALAFHFSAAFYSNQEHVDIVRAVAWLPWILFVLHPHGFRFRWGAVIAAVVLSQMLTSGYPGNLVSTVYGCGFWVLLLASGEGKGRAIYLISVATSVVAGTLMAMPKWLPLILNGSAGLSIEHLPPSPFNITHFLTLVMPYTLDRLPGDLTMRSLWIPLGVIWGIAFADYRSRVFWLGAGLVMLGVVMGMGVRASEHLSHLMPGMLVSRFPLSDWRPLIDVGFIISGCVGWNRFVSRGCSARAVALRSLVASGVVTVILVCASLAGYPVDSLIRPLIAVWVLASFSVGAQWVPGLASGHDRYMSAVKILLIVIVGVEGYWYQTDQTAAWRSPWTREDERVIVGGYLSDYLNSRPSQGQIPTRRPARFVLGATAEAALPQRNSLLYNRCWYAASYCVFSYDNMRMSVPHRNFIAALERAGGDALLHFVSNPQQLAVIPQAGSDQAPDPAGSDAAVIGDASGVSVAFLQYAPDSVLYRVSAVRDTTLVENELWWPGWRMEACNTQGCQSSVATKPTSQSLRSWKVKAGDWTVRLRYAGPSYLPGYLCLGVGLLLALLGGVYARGWHAATDRLVDHLRKRSAKV